MEFDYDITRRFIVQRARRRLTQHDAGRIASVGNPHIRAFESGEIEKIPINTLLRLMRLERKWAFEEVRRVLFRTGYHNNGAMCACCCAAVIGQLTGEKTEIHTHRRRNRPNYLRKAS